MVGKVVMSGSVCCCVLGRRVDVLCSVVCWHAYGVLAWVWCGVFVGQVHAEWMLAPGRTSRLLWRGCWAGVAPRDVSY